LVKNCVRLLDNTPRDTPAVAERLEGLFALVIGPGAGGGWHGFRAEALHSLGFVVI
jgi:hypothetical protein